MTDTHLSETIVDTITDHLRPLRRAAFGLGSNVGEREEYLQRAVNALLDSPEIQAFAVSPVYETTPVGGVSQPDYLNAVLVVDTTLSPRSLLERAMAVEEALGRDRSVEERWGPRTLDVDLLAVGDRSLDNGDVVVPHPRLHERAFVLAPWADVDPSFEVPGRGEVSDLLGKVESSGIRRTDIVLSLP